MAQEPILETLVDIPIVIGATYTDACPIRPGDIFSYTVRLSHIGKQSLRWNEPHPLHLSYRWLSESGEILERDGRRTSLPGDEMKPETHFDVVMHGETPDAPGPYKLQISLLLEGVHWACEVSNTGWLNVAVRLDAIPAWPVTLKKSFSGRALRGALVASQIESFLDGESFDIKSASLKEEPEAHTAEVRTISSSDRTSLRDPQYINWRRKFGSWIRASRR